MNKRKEMVAPIFTHQKAIKSHDIQLTKGKISLYTFNTQVIKGRYEIIDNISFDTVTPKKDLTIEEKYPELFECSSKLKCKITFSNF